MLDILPRVFNAVRMDAQILQGTANLGEGLLLLQTHQGAAILEESRLNASATASMVISLLSRASEMILLRAPVHPNLGS